MGMCLHIMGENIHFVSYLEGYHGLFQTSTLHTMSDLHSKEDSIVGSIYKRRKKKKSYPMIKCKRKKINKRWEVTHTPTDVSRKTTMVQINQSATVFHSKNVSPSVRQCRDNSSSTSTAFCVG